MVSFSRPDTVRLRASTTAMTALAASTNTTMAASTSRNQPRLRARVDDGDVVVEAAVIPRGLLGLVDHRVDEIHGWPQGQFPGDVQQALLAEPLAARPGPALEQPVGEQHQAGPGGP